MARVVYDFYMTQAARALEIACDSRKRKSYRLNRPLEKPLRAQFFAAASLFEVAMSAFFRVPYFSVPTTRSLRSSKKSKHVMPPGFRLSSGTKVAIPEI